MYARKRNGVLAVVIANTLSKSAAILGIKKSHLKELFQNVLDMPALLLWWKWELHSLKLIMASVKCTLAKRKKIMLNSIKSKGQHCADLLASRRNLCFSGLDSGIEEFSNIPSSPSSPFWRSFARFGAITRIFSLERKTAPELYRLRPAVKPALCDGSLGRAADGKTCAGESLPQSWAGQLTPWAMNRISDLVIPITNGLIDSYGEMK